MPLFTQFPAEPILEVYGLQLATGGTTHVLSQNTVYLGLVRVLGVTVVTNMRVHVGSTATGHFDAGIYSLDGTTLLGHTGVTLASASTIMTTALTANVTLTSGFYWIAFGCDSATDTYSNASTIALPGSESGCRQATNAYSAGLPASTGTIAAPGGVFPLFCAITSGGLP